MTEERVEGTILLVDDDEVLRRQLSRALERRGWTVFLAEGYDEAMACVKAESPDRVVVDLRMPGRSGLEVVRDVVAEDETTEIVVLTGYGSIATAVEATKLGAVNYLPKPADADDVLAAFERAHQPLDAVTEPFEPPSLARAEWEHIQRVLADCGQNISETARRLGIHRRSLQRKLQMYPPNK
mgnify:CR=1 FL=1